MSNTHGDYLKNKLITNHFQSVLKLVFSVTPGENWFLIQWPAELKHYLSMRCSVIFFLLIVITWCDTGVTYSKLFAAA